MKKKNNRLSTYGKKAESSMKTAIAKVYLEHKFKKIPIAVWRNGKVVKISPQKIETNP